VKKVLMLVIGILVLWMITPAMAPPVIEFPVSGYYWGSADPDAPGKLWITEDGILHIKGAVGEGPLSGDIPGTMMFTLNAEIDLNTGVGVMHGKYVAYAEYGDFEGTYRTENTGVVNYEGTAVAQGTDAYEGMVMRTSFWGYNLYLMGYTGPDGVYFDYEAIILSSHGEPLP
jgi:hypothetical protein